jgi:SAM-dependent methyltransferase
MQVSDRIRYFFHKIRMRKKNELFLLKNDGIKLPPDYLMYESFLLDYQRYYENGRKTAEWLINLVRKHQNLDNTAILDWGCGPARVLRHLPELAPEAKSFNGTDYNAKTISWCAENLREINFSNNSLMPPLSYQNDSFDLIYGISIFTHLSEEAHVHWLEELIRVLRKGGILFLTLHGEGFYNKLSEQEKQVFKSGKLVVRGQVKEGHRTFAAFQASEYVKKWTGELQLLEHLPGNNEQDVWVFKKA